MGTLRDLSTGIDVDLRARHRVGRADGADLRLADPGVSGDHALLRWELGSWLVQDLSSTNGVFVDGRRIQVGEAVPLGPGARLGFGSQEASWELVDDAPPEAYAEAAGERRSAQEGKISLPDAQRPRCVVTLDPTRGWLAKDAAGERPVRDGERVSEGGREWVLRLPEVLPRTARRGRSTSVARCRLRYRMSQDEESVDLTLLVDGEERRVGEAVWGYFVVCLARAHSEDALRGVAPAEQGWRERAELERELRTRDNQLNVWVHRFRKRLAELGVEDAELAIEGRDRGRVIRLGIPAQDG